MAKSKLLSLLGSLVFIALAIYGIVVLARAEKYEERTPLNCDGKVGMEGKICNCIKDCSSKGYTTSDQIMACGMNCALN